jgi:frataxin-like iron-binding protein CyaY
MFSDVSWVDCMEALAALQLTTDCVARMLVNKQQLAEHVIVMTKALSEAHFRYVCMILL